jgi:hypothetical protein
MASFVEGAPDDGPLAAPGAVFSIPKQKAAAPRDGGLIANRASSRGGA